jgi:hypothetical protein
MDTHGQALILKAALRYFEDTRDQRYKHLVRDTRLSALAEVAADVLQIVTAPYAFSLGIKEAAVAVPLPPVLFSHAAKAQLLRSEWRDQFLAAFEASVAGTLQRASS